MIGKKMLSVLVFGFVLAAATTWADQGTTQENTVDISKLTCKELMSGDDSDREVGMAFYHGFLAGKKNNQVLNVSEMGSTTDKVKDYCLSNPTSTVMDAFTKSAM